MRAHSYAGLAVRLGANLAQRRRENPGVDRDCPDNAVSTVLETLALWYGGVAGESEEESRGWVAECARVAASS